MYYITHSNIFSENGKFQIYTTVPQKPNTSNVHEEAPTRILFRA